MKHIFAQLKKHAKSIWIIAFCTSLLLLVICNPNIEHIRVVEEQANQIRNWDDRETAHEAARRHMKILNDNNLLAKKAFLEDTENLEYQQPIPDQYPWEHVALSMLRFPDKVILDYDRCPKCGQSRIRLFFYSPEWTWNMNCGVGGEMTVCPQCKVQAEFDDRIRD